MENHDVAYHHRSLEGSFQEQRLSFLNESLPQSDPGLIGQIVRSLTTMDKHNLEKVLNLGSAPQDHTQRTTSTSNLSQSSTPQASPLSEQGFIHVQAENIGGESQILGDYQDLTSSNVPQPSPLHQRPDIKNDSSSLDTDDWGPLSSTEIEASYDGASFAGHAYPSSRRDCDEGMPWLGSPRGKGKERAYPASALYSGNYQAAGADMMFHPHEAQSSAINSTAPGDIYYLSQTQPQTYNNNATLAPENNSGWPAEDQYLGVRRSDADQELTDNPEVGSCAIGLLNESMFQILDDFKTWKDS